MTKEQTTILKGGAIRMMLVLHLFNGSNLTEVCEPLLILSAKHVTLWVYS